MISHMIRNLLLGAVFLGLPGVLGVAVPTENIFNIATSMIVEGQDIEVFWNFDTGDGRNNFYLKRHIYNPSNGQIVFQEETYHSYSSSAGIVSGSFVIPASYTYLSKFELDIKAYGTRSGIHVGGGAFSHLIAKNVTPHAPYKDKLLTLNQEVPGNRQLFVNTETYDVSFLLEGVGRASKRRECGMSRFRFIYEYPEGYVTAPESVAGKLFIPNLKNGEMHIGKWTPPRRVPLGESKPAGQTIIIVGQQISDRNGKAQYEFVTKDYYIVDRRTFHSREFSGEGELTEFLTNDVYIPLGVDEGERGLSFEVEFGPFGENGDSFIFKWSESTFVGLSDAGFSVVLGGE